jgi:hypothetical protein
MPDAMRSQQPKLLDAIRPVVRLRHPAIPTDPAALAPVLQNHLTRFNALHQGDLAQGHGRALSARTTLGASLLMVEDLLGHALGHLPPLRAHEEQGLNCSGPSKRSGN